MPDDSHNLWLEWDPFAGLTLASLCGLILGYEYYTERIIYDYG